MKIYRLTPTLHNNIWGGNKLRGYGKDSTDDRIGESWELSFVKGDEAKIPDGRTLAEAFPRETWGRRCQGFADFPVLTKFIDAKEKLSVQVHPSDEYALKNEGMYGKTEMWYVMDAEEGAGLYMGLNRECHTEEFSEKVADGTVEELLSFKPVKSGDVFFIPAGTIHAIGGGVLIYEIQQNSTLTYRLYDYKRKDKDGNERPLHIEKAMKVSRLEPYTPYDFSVEVGGEKHTSATGRCDGVTLGKCKYFHTQLFRILADDDVKLFSVNDESYLALTVVEGSGSLCYADENGKRVFQKLTRGESYFIPAGSGDFALEGDGMTVITVETPGE